MKLLTGLFGYVLLMLGVILALHHDFILGVLITASGFLCFGECYHNMMSEVDMTYNWCHGPECHTRQTVDRIRGSKGNKVLRTRKITENSWNQRTVWSHFCSQGCYTDFMHKHWQQVPLQ